MLVRKFESSPIPVWAWLELFLNPKRYHLKQNRLNYQPLFGKRARDSRLRENRASTVKTRALFNCNRFVCTQKMRKKSLNCTSKSRTSILELFTWESSRTLISLLNSTEGSVFDKTFTYVSFNTMQIDIIDLCLQ